MDPNKAKMKMYETLESVIRKAQERGISEDELVYNLTLELGVSGLSIRKRLKLLQRLGKITQKVEDEAYIWVI